jgi:hypothetical protein
VVCRGLYVFDANGAEPNGFLHTLSDAQGTALLVTDMGRAQIIVAGAVTL